MSELVSVILTGEVLPGRSRDEVVGALATLLKTTESHALALLSRGETVVKRDVPAGDAGRYIQALGKAGACARFEPTPAASAPPLAVVKPAAVPVREGPSGVENAAADGLALAPAWSSPASGEAAAEETMSCPDCGFVQTPRTLCRNCGCHMARAGAAREAKRAEAATARSPYALGESAPRLRDAADEDTATPPAFGMSTVGRLGRLRYLAYSWPIFAVVVAIGIVAAVVVPKHAMLGAIVLIPGFVVAFWMSIRVLVLRMHDVNISGKWLWAMLAFPFVAGLLRMPGLAPVFVGLFWLGVLVLIAWPGTDGENNYGPPCEPNTTPVRVGAVIFIVFQILGIAGNIGMMRSGKFPPFGAGLQPPFAGAPRIADAAVGRGNSPLAEGTAPAASLPALPAHGAPVGRAWRTMPLPNPEHGGQVFEKYGVDYEVAVRGKTVTVYVTERGKPVGTEGATGFVSYRQLQPPRIRRFDLVPAGDNKMQATIEDSPFEPGDAIHVGVYPRNRAEITMSLEVPEVGSGIVAPGEAEVLHRLFVDGEEAVVATPYFGAMLAMVARFASGMSARPGP